MTVQQENRQAIVDYLEGGCKGGEMGSLGVELEQFLVDEDGDPIGYDEKHRPGVRDILEKLSEFYPNAMRTEAGDIMGCSRASASSA